LKILISSIACSPRLGSESLVGFRSIEALAKAHETTVITSSDMLAPNGSSANVIPIRLSEPNDIKPWQLLQFERQQRRLVQHILCSHTFDAFHRVVPSGLKHTTLPVPSIPFVIGPVLRSDKPPESFARIIHPQLPRRHAIGAMHTRLKNGLARRVFARHSTLNDWLEHARLILVGTQVTLRRLPGHLHTKCRLISYAGVEHEIFKPPRVRRANKIPQLLFVGRLIPYKGLELLLRSAALAQRRCRFELTIIGQVSTTYGSYCQKLVRKLNLSSTVQFVPNQQREKLAKFYQGADVFCMPSIETYGIAILEAMSSGCTVLVSDFNGPGEIVGTHFGVKVPLESPEQFITDYSERIVELVEDAGLRAKFGQQAREHVLKHHDWRQIGARLLDVYAEFFPGKPSYAECGLPSYVTTRD
jgi:glycosyltransferase involved in cell wall biosynthesis